MHPGIFIGLALFFGVFALAGSAASMFIFYTIGFAGMGVFIFFMGLAIPNRSEKINKSFQTEKNLPTILVKGCILLIGITMLLVSTNYWRDLPLYQQKKYAILMGNPAAVGEYKTKGTVNSIYVEINGKTLDLDLVPNFPAYERPEELKQRYFRIYYLPHTDWIIDYTVE